MAQTTVILDEESNAILTKLLDEQRYPDRETAINQAFRLLRDHNEEHEERLDLVRWEIEKGIASGVAEGNPFERFRARHSLPARVAQ